MVSSMRTLSRRRMVLGLVAAVFSAMLLLGSLMRHEERSASVDTTAIEITRSLHSTNRKLLDQAEEPNRIAERCTKEDIQVYQAPTEPLPNGIPTYSVQIINSCATECSISDIHFSCGWFSSARMVNPKVFKRLRYDDCLVNNGEALSFGASLSFQYATTFSYPLSVSSVTCH